MGESSDQFVLEQQADAMDALASKLWYGGYDRLAGRLHRVAALLREPLRDDDEEGGSHG